MNSEKYINTITKKEGDLSWKDQLSSRGGS